MTFVAIIAALATVNWLATDIVTRAFVFHLSREQLDIWEAKALRLNSTNPNPRTFFLYEIASHAAYLHKCALCAGTWIAFVQVALLATIVPIPGGVLGGVAAALLIKGLAHWLHIAQFDLESRAAVRERAALGSTD